METKTAIILLLGGVILFFIILAINSNITLNINDKNSTNIPYYNTTNNTTNTIISTTNEDAMQIIYTCFSPITDCSPELIRKISSANKTIYAATYEMNYGLIANALISAKNRGVDVRIIFDDDTVYTDKYHSTYTDKTSFAQLKDAGLSVAVDSGSGLMHNKFYIFDNETVWVGSQNPTSNDILKNDNYVLLLNNTIITKNYLTEFDEMWSSKLFGAKSPSTNTQINNISETILANYFCPEDNCSQHLRTFIKNAKGEIDCGFFTFTDKQIGQEIISKQQQGVKVRVIIEKRQGANTEQYNALKSAGVDVKYDGNGNTMHWKACVSGDEVWAGSYNPTGAGNKLNDENVVVIKNQKLANLFKNEFERIYALGTN